MVKIFGSGKAVDILSVSGISFPYTAALVQNLIDNLLLDAFISDQVVLSENLILSTVVV